VAGLRDPKFSPRIRFNWLSRPQISQADLNINDAWVSRAFLEEKTEERV